MWKTIPASFLVLLILAVTATARNSQIWNTFHSDGSSTMLVPNGSGGYGAYGPDGSTTMIIPNGTGGYNIYR